MKRVLSMMLVLAWSTPAVASPYDKIISVEGCAPVGPEFGYLDSASAFHNLSDDLTSVGWDTVVYLCDADLPSTATAFDFAELEYIGGYQAQPPWVAAYVNAEGVGIQGARYSWVEEIGWCGGEVAVPGPWLPPTTPTLTVCRTTGGLSWAGAGASSRARALAILFLVFVPPMVGQSSQSTSTEYWWAAMPNNMVYRLIVHYEAP